MNSEINRHYFRRGIILGLIYEFENSESKEWKSSEIVDFLLSKLEENNFRIWVCPECSFENSLDCWVCNNCHFQIDDSTHAKYIKD